MKKLIRLLVSVVVVLIIATYISQFFHICTGCKNFFVGAGYEENKLVNAVISRKGILCKECAEKHHVLSVGLGKTVEDYKKTVELNPLTIIQKWLTD